MFKKMLETKLGSDALYDEWNVTLTKHLKVALSFQLV